MPDRQNSESAGPRAAPRIPETTVTAAAATVAWLVIGGLVLWSGAGDAAGVPGVRLLALGLPVAMIWLGAFVARTVLVLRGDVARLEATVAALSRALRDRGPAQPPAAPAPQPVSQAVSQSVPQSGPPPVATPAAVAPAALATPQFTSQPTPRPAPPPPAVIRPLEEQPSLALGPEPGTEADPAPLDRPDLIRALNFPENDQDAAGFAALRRALRDRRARQLIQAAQDVLTLLSQDGIYTDDLRPDRARPEIWRRFAQGERGRSVAQLGGIHDRSCLGLTVKRMREDTIFRDTAHHFLRLFDRSLTAFEPEASDEEIAALAETRTARAFMLLGRVTGAFD